MAADRSSPRPDGGAGDTPLGSTSVIASKRDGGTLSPETLQEFVAAYLEGKVDDAQMAAFLMAGTIQGFSDDEAIALTDALLASGAVLDLDDLTGPTVDKHSTGGVGDATTLVVAPMLAAAGCQVAKLSGRGLGHTGGTLDKLESIPGFQVELGSERLRAQVARVGLALAAATDDLVPADRRLYALRDVTGTVESAGLIASSVMSKKLAGGAHHILLDVKVGTGAFMPDVDAARHLATLCVRIGQARGRVMGALVTDMSQPLADAVGNALEVAVAVETLQSVRHGRFRDLCIELTASLLQLTGIDPSAAVSTATEVLDQGHALERFRQLVEAQDGDPRVADVPWDVLPVAPVVLDYTGPAGFVTQIQARRLGELAGLLGAGRRRQGDTVDPAVGLELLARPGDAVETSTPLARIHARTPHAAQQIHAQLGQAIKVGARPPPPAPLVRARVGFSPAPTSR